MSKYVHVELSVNSWKDDQPFYKNVFGWEFMDFPDLNYASTSEGVTTGLNPVSENNPAGTVWVYIHTEDTEASLTAIKENGGAQIGETMFIPNVGTIAFFSDPTGNRLALLQPDPNAQGM